MNKREAVSTRAHSRVLDAVTRAMSSARLTQDDLVDERRRSELIDHYNARIGGVEERLARAEISPISAEGATAIPQHLRRADIDDFLDVVERGALTYVLFAGGRATRLQLPKELDALGIAGLTPALLQALPSDSLGSDELRGMEGALDTARRGSTSSVAHLSFLQRYVLQLRAQLQTLTSSADSRHSLSAVLAGLQIVVIANASNLRTLAGQLRGVNYAGFDPSRIYMLEQSEHGGLLVADSGPLGWTDHEAWPLGHGEPFLAMNRSDSIVFQLSRTGDLTPLEVRLGDALRSGGGEYATIAQVNDLHLLRDPLATERVVTALTHMRRQQAGMVIEVVDNTQLKQKGGAIFERADGFVEMRDTIALRSPTLQNLSIPQYLSRMFYVIKLSELARVDEDALPAYLNVRKTRSGEAVLSLEYLSGDMTSTLRSLAMQQTGFPLWTFKARDRVGAALEAIAAQDVNLEWNPTR